MYSFKLCIKILDRKVLRRRISLTTFIQRKTLKKIDAKLNKITFAYIKKNFYLKKYACQPRNLRKEAK